MAELWVICSGLYKLGFLCWGAVHEDSSESALFAMNLANVAWQWSGGYRHAEYVMFYLLTHPVREVSFCCIYVGGAVHGRDEEGDRGWCPSKSHFSVALL